MANKGQKKAILAMALLSFATTKLKSFKLLGCELQDISSQHSPQRAALNGHAELENWEVTTSKLINR